MDNFEFRKKRIEKVLNSLKPDEAEILKARYGLIDGKVKTLEELEKLFNVPEDQIRVLEIKFFRLLKKLPNVDDIN